MKPQSPSGLDGCAEVGAVVWFVSCKFLFFSFGGRFWTVRDVRRGGRGFSLIEICIALFVTLALFSLAVGIVRLGMKEGDLHRLRDETATLVKTARALAMQDGEARELILEPSRIILKNPAVKAGSEWVVEIPLGVRFEVQRWPDDRWIVPERSTVWLFQPSGLCAPYSLRFSQGESWIAFRIHPLTGAIDNESRMLQK